MSGSRRDIEARSDKLVRLSIQYRCMQYFEFPRRVGSVPYHIFSNTLAELSNFREL